MPDIESRGFKIALDRHGPRVDPDTQSRLVSEAAADESEAESVVVRSIAMVLVNKIFEPSERRQRRFPVAISLREMKRAP